MDMKKLWIVAPAHNEEKTITGIIGRIKKFSKNIIIVDDGSTDKTEEKAKKEDVVVLKHIVNIGKGAALKTGCDYAFKKGAEGIIVIDTDAQHRPEDIPKFIKKLESSDIVFSYRKRNKVMPFVLRFGNFVINKIIKFLYGVNIKDSQCGFRAFSVKAYKKIRWSASDYSMESEMIANTGKHKLRYSEVGIETIYQDKYKGTTILDGIKIVLNMTLWRIFRRD